MQKHNFNAGWHIDKGFKKTGGPVPGEKMNCPRLYRQHKKPPLVG